MIPRIIGEALVFLYRQDDHDGTAVLLDRHGGRPGVVNQATKPVLSLARRYVLRDAPVNWEPF
jgi:hypothetical protein